jgi:hypothetical protein
MSYLGDEPNVRDFYIKFCEYLETETEKNAFNRHITESYIQYPYSPNIHSYLIYVYIRFTQFDNFPKFKRLYLEMNPDLIIYENEINKHTFNFEIFREQFEEFNNHHVSCLK